MNKTLLGIDVGTSAVKAVLCDTNGRVLGTGVQEFPTQYVRPGWVEQHPEDWWRATCDAIRAAIRDANIESIAAVCVSSQAPAMVPVDASGKPLHPALIWMDRRAGVETQDLVDLIGGGELFAITGNRADPYFVAAKIRWLSQNEPALMAKTHQILQVNGYINLRLTGEFSLDSSHLGLLQLADYRTGQWSTSLLDACGVSPDQLPTPHPCHQICGEVTAAAAEATGLRAGTPVLVGTVDASAAALEAGIVSAGHVVEMTGTSTVIIMADDAYRTDPTLISMPHGIDGSFLLIAAMVATGANLRWYRNEFGTTETELGAKLRLDPYDLLTQQAAEIGVGSDGVIFLPYMMGERTPIWHTDARGVFFGLSLATPRAALIRAILEGSAFGMRHNIDVAKEAGITFDEIRSVGGGSRSALWNQIKADVLGIPITLPQTSIGAPFGDAILAGIGAGLYDDPQATINNMVRVGDRYEPNPENHQQYNNIYTLYRNLYEHLREDFDYASKIFG